MNASRVGLLLLNLGTPDAPTTKAVRRYLREFLWDPRVIDLPGPQRWLLLNLIILPFRPRKSAEAYRKVFTERGSPLLFYGQDLVESVRAQLPDVVVELAMRYGNPSIESALDRLAAQGVDRIVAFPLYPQYATASTGSTIEAVARAVGERWIAPSLHFVPAFYDHPAFIEAVVEPARPVLAALEPERVVFSYHGLPERHLHRGDPEGKVCLRREGCCEQIGADNHSCYRAQCVATTRALGEALGVPPEQRVLCFQSRLGRTPWIKPYTDEVLPQLAAEGIKKIAVLTPAFVTDCLETLEEIGMRAREEWLAAGGEAFELVPCPNASETFAKAVVRIAQEGTTWLGAREPSTAWRVNALEGKA